MSAEQEKDFIAKVKKNLDDSLSNIDGATRSSLTRIRYQALAAGNSPKAPYRHWLQENWSRLAGLSAVLLVVLLIFHDRPSPPPLPSLARDITSQDLEILVEEDQIDILNDLEILTLLAEDEPVEG